MSAAVTELDANLQALSALKPPGVTKSKIAAITALCIENIASESVLVQNIFVHFKRTLATHKLGVLYVVDSVTRQWVDKARVTGQELTGAAAPDGTYAAGVHKMTELLPVLMNDLIQSAPNDQMEKVGKLLDIWERGNTFPVSLLSDFKSKLNSKSKAAPTHVAPTHVAPPPAVPSVPLVAPPISQAPATHGPGNAFPISNQAQPAWTAANSIPTSALESLLRAAPAAPAAPPLYNPPPPAPVPNNVGLAQALESVIPPHIRADKAALQQQIQILQQLATLNVPQEQWPTVLAAINAQQAAVPQTQPSAPLPFTPSMPQYQNNTQPQPQSQPQTQTYRNRSRSPPRRRGSPDYGYSRSGEGNYRQRSPVRDSTPSRQEDVIPLDGGPRWTDYDPTLPANNIKVLSRTLFVGGVTCTDVELREIFNRFGKVQTVIAQAEKRHAFVKMCTRADAVNAKEMMEHNRDADVSSRIRSTRWGVGFGPRDCSDYATGVSIIPIERLTEADKKWVVTAPFGGTGGKPLASGLVMEEPDIEIGAGVSSKAISRRVGGAETNRRSGGGGGGAGGQASSGGNFQGRGGGNNNNNSSSSNNNSNQNQQHQRQDSATARPQDSQPAAQMPLGFGFPGMPGWGGGGMGMGMGMGTGMGNGNGAPGTGNGM